MKGMNTGRIIIGGIVAGLIMTVGETVMSVIKNNDPGVDVTQTALPVVGQGGLGFFLIFGLLFGITMVFTYAAMRPRLGPGPKTACVVALGVWVFAYLYPGIGLATIGQLKGGMVGSGLLVSLILLLIASNAGAWLYKEP